MHFGLVSSHETSHLCYRVDDPHEAKYDKDPSNNADERVLHSARGEEEAGIAKRE